MGLDFSLVDGGGTSGFGPLSGDFGSPSGGLTGDFGGSTSGGGSPVLTSGPKPTGSTSSQGQQPPQRLDFNSFFGNLFSSQPQAPDPTLQGAGDFISNLGAVPGRTMESPFSTLNVLTGAHTSATPPADILGKQVTFGKSSPGLLDQAISAVGKTPIGQIGGAVNDFLNTSSKVGSSLVNYGDMQRLTALGNQPDSALLRDVDPTFFSSLGTNPLNYIARALDFNSTVGDFRKEMAARGFTPQDVAQNANARGVQGTLDNLSNLGSHQSNSNPLIAMGQSLALDPTNLAFALGPMKAVKAGLDLLPSMEKLGLAAKTVPDAITSARAISEGQAAGVTLSGVGHFIANSLSNPDRIIKAYALGSTAYDLGVAATDTTADWLSNALPKDSPVQPFLADLHGLASSIINNHPLSQGAAYNFFAAFHYPIRDAASPALQKAAGVVADKITGGSGTLTEFANLLGKGDSLGARKDDFLQRIGGIPGFLQLVGHIADKVTVERISPTIRDKFGSIDSASVREAQFHGAVHVIRDRLLSTGKIGNADLINTFKQWWGDQGGFEGTGVNQAWDPQAALDHWTNTWVPIQQQWGKLAWERAGAVIGLEPTLTVENIADIKSILKSASVANDGVVPLDVLRDTFQSYPQLVKNVTKFSKYGVPDAVAPRWDTVRDALTQAGREAPTSAELTHELGWAEKNAPAAPTVPDGPLGDGQVAEQGGNREMPPEFARDVVGQTPPQETTFSALPGEPAVPPDTKMPEPPATEARVPSMDDMAPVRAAQDEAQGLSPEQVTQNQQRDTEAVRIVQSAAPSIDWTGEGHYASATDEAKTINAELKAQFPGYRLTPPPKIATLLHDAEITSPQIVSQITRMNGLYEWLRYSSPLSPLGNALSKLLDPVPSSKMRDDQMQAIYNYALPRGAAPGDIQAIVNDLRAFADKQTVGFGSLHMPLFSKWDNLLPSTIEAYAQQHLSPEAYAQIKRDFGGFTKLVDRSANRVVQAAHASEGRLGAALETVYGDYQKTLGAPLRYVKSFYPILRFIGSPRFWLMNGMEANILGLVKYGTGAGDGKAGLSSYVHEFNKLPGKRLADEAAAVAKVDDAAPFVTGRSMAGYIQSAFDGLTMESAQKVLDDLPANAPEFRYLQQRFGPNQGTWAQQLNDMLYSFDTKGVRKSITDEAARLFSQEDAQRLTPMLQKLYEINDSHFKALKNVFEGNNSRSNLERILNSYFLYWPLTYQLKAGKWIFDVATERAFGRKTNFAGAYTYSHVLQAHQQMLVNDPAYAQMFKDNPDIFFAAQMLLPIIPADMGVSLNRGIRYAGGALGWWGAYQQASDPVTAAQAMAKLGLTYDLDLLSKAKANLDKQNKPKAAPKQTPQPYVPTYSPPAFGSPQGFVGPHGPRVKPDPGAEGLPPLTPVPASALNPNVFNPTVPLDASQVTDQRNAPVGAGG